VKSQRGDPCIALRLPKEQIEALRAMAEHQHTTLSALVREAIDSSQAWRNYTKPAALEGQIMIDENA